MSKKTEFNYCVGHYWNEKDGQISVYTYHSEVHYGTMKDAESFRKYVEKKTGEKCKIFQLVEIPE